MIINLNDGIPLGFIENYQDEYKLKSNKLVSYLNRINMNMKNKFNYIIIPVTVYNILECNDRFKPIFYYNDYENLKKVGTLGEFEVYLDIHLQPDEIILSWDKSISRDVKINNILYNTNEKEKKIKVIP